MKISISKKILVSIYHFLMFFALVAFVVTCNMTLFLNLLQRSSGIVYTEENIQLAAIFTFWNAVFLGFLFATVNLIRRKILVEKPVNKIHEFTQKIIHGDFSARIKPMRTSEYNEIVADLNKMAEELSGVETLRTDFISNVSHEMKTPLSVLQNYGTLLCQPNLEENKKQEYAKTIVSTSAYMTELVSNILKMNKLENQNIYPNSKPYCVSEQLCECLLAFENAWEQKELDIETDIDSDVFISTDAELLAIVWNNLFSNAVKFTDKGGKISVSLKSNNNDVTVKISDTGCGMSKETIEHIFDKFYQGDSSHATKGNGLGLALVKRVIDLLGGQISVASAVGVGSTFTIILNINNSQTQ